MTVLRGEVTLSRGANPRGDASPSGDASNPAIWGRVKTGHFGSGSVRDWVEVYLAASC